MSGIATEPLAWRDGVPFSERYGDVYASRDGALGQARHVFLGGNQLPARWAQRAQFTVLETGFGLGTNVLATWQAWRDDAARPRRLHIVSVEAHPVAAQALRAAAPAALAPLAHELAAQWPLPLPGLHRLGFDDGAVTLTLAFGDAAVLLPRLVLGADAIYLDGFAPDRNPAMWSPPLLKAVARLARPDATLATWCTARAVREALAAGGFDLALRDGYGRKRQMLTGRYAPRFVVRRHEPPAAYAGERRAMVIGAGLAGCSAALALARRGWDVDLVEQGAHVAAGASALPAGQMHPLLAADDSRLARLTRAGAAAALNALRALDADGRFARCDGLFQQADSDAEFAAWQAALARLGFPPAFAEPLDADAAAARLGMRPRRGGLWFAAGAVIDAGAWCRAMVAQAGTRLRLHLNARAAPPWRADEQWQLRAGEATLHAPVVVHAAALSAPALAATAMTPLAAVRGRLSLLAADDLPALRHAITGDGYAMPAPPTRRGALIGASYELRLPGAAASEHAADANNDDAIHAGNLARLHRLLAAAPAVTRRALFDQWRAVPPDRLPYAGALADEADALARRAALRGAHLADLPRQPGAYALFGLASRGLTLAPLLGDLVAAQAEGEPWPIERDLAAAVDPARVLLSRLRR
jgi:tRNA 5-methylaminomethyl-2-thiouridine biosynthesis bifunctional protein